MWEGRGEGVESVGVVVLSCMARWRGEPRCRAGELEGDPFRGSESGIRDRTLPDSTRSGSRGGERG